MDNSVLFKLTYGLFVLSTRTGKRTNGCMVNTVTQISSEPLRLGDALNKQNLTHDMVLVSGICIITILSKSAPFELIKNFGFQSGRDADKFSAVKYKTAQCGVPYIDEGACAYIECRVTGTVDSGSHTLFIVECTGGEALSNEEPMTYAYYHSDVKPQPAPAEKQVKGWRCTICGYIYEGETLPENFTCPVCKHGQEVFEKIE